MASVLRYFTLSKIQHSKFCLNYCKENVTNLIQLFSWQYLAVHIMHIYGIKNTCLWNHKRKERRAFSFVSCMDVYCLVLIPYCFLFFVFTVWALSFAWALEPCSRNMCWRVCSLSHGCQEGTGEGGVKVSWRQVVWSWKPGGFVFCWKFLIVARAQWLGRWLKWANSCLTGKKALRQVWEGGRLERCCLMQ